jgi:hypothetical protein
MAMLSYAAACKADCVKQNPFGFTQSLLRLFHFTQGEAFHARLLPPARNSGFGFDFESEERASRQSKTKYGDLSVRSGSELKLKTE